MGDICRAPWLAPSLPHAKRPTAIEAAESNEGGGSSAGASLGQLLRPVFRALAEDKVDSAIPDEIGLVFIVGRRTRQ
jgi:hypothetical protein